MDSKSSKINKFALTLRREKLEDSRRFQYFKRDADELETWIHEKLSTAAEETFKDTTNLQAKIQKHQAFEAEVTMRTQIFEILASGWPPTWGKDY